MTLPCGGWRSDDEIDQWTLAGKQYPFNARIRVNDFNHLLKLALNDEIITELPPLFAAPYFDSGELMQLFPKLPMPE